MSNEILYIHGFASSVNSLKANILKDYFARFGYYNVIIPNIPVEPFRAINFLEEIYENNPIKVTVGSSLGGFYALYMHMKHPVQTVLINPSLNPHLDLKDAVGPVKRHNSEDFFQWTEDHVRQLEELVNQLDISKLDQTKLHFFLAKDDELLDFSDIKKLFPYATVKFFDNAGHAFKPFAKVLPDIMNLYASQL